MWEEKKKGGSAGHELIKVFTPERKKEEKKEKEHVRTCLYRRLK